MAGTTPDSPAAVDPRVFAQIEALPTEDALRELAALVRLADLGMVDRAIGEAARARALVLAPEPVPLPMPEGAPEGTRREAYGFYETPDGRRLCEDCWQPIPAYLDFPAGLTSPQSDGDAGGNFAKKRLFAVEGKTGVEALRKAVCLPCYFTAFAVVYPDAPLPDLNPAFRETHHVEPPPPPMVWVEDPMKPKEGDGGESHPSA